MQSSVRGVLIERVSAAMVYGSSDFAPSARRAYLAAASLRRESAPPEENNFAF